MEIVVSEAEEEAEEVEEMEMLPMFHWAAEFGSRRIRVME